MGLISLGRSTIHDHYYYFCYYYYYHSYFLICICACRDSQVQAQAQTEAITEEDLRLIQERETSIRQLEVQIRIKCPYQHGH